MPRSEMQPAWFASSARHECAGAPDRSQEHEKSELTSTRFVPWLRRPAERTQDAISYQ